MDLKQAPSSPAPHPHIFKEMKLRFAKYIQSGRNNLHEFKIYFTHSAKSLTRIQNIFYAFSEITYTNSKYQNRFFKMPILKTKMHFQDFCLVIRLLGY